MAGLTKPVQLSGFPVQPLGSTGLSSLLTNSGSVGGSLYRFDHVTFS